MLRRLRTRAGLTQAELAARAGVSRQLVGAVEAGRHLPRVDAALALADALGVDVDVLFRSPPRPLDVLTGAVPADGSLVRAGRVGDLTVTAAVRATADGWDVPDGAVEEGRFVAWERHAPGPVVVGCEPGLAVLEGLLREKGRGALAVAGSSTAAVEALRGGRTHLAVVHGSAPSPPPDLDVERFHLTRWQVGLAGPAEAAEDWWRRALGGTVAVVQREPGAAVQRTFERALDPGVVSVSGPRVGTHLEAARRAVLTGMVAVTIEPAARAAGARFHPLEVHRAEMWVGADTVDHQPLSEALEAVTDRRFRSRLERVGGYDLAGAGERVA